MKCKFNKDKTKSALKKAGLAVRGLEHFIMASDKYFKSLSKKEADSVQKDLLRFISSTKARSSFSMRGGVLGPDGKEIEESKEVVGNEGEASVVVEPGTRNLTQEPQAESEEAAAEAVSNGKSGAPEVSVEEAESNKKQVEEAPAQELSPEEAAIQQAEAAEAAEAAQQAAAAVQGSAATVVNEEEPQAEATQQAEKAAAAVQGSTATVVNEEEPQGGGSAFGLQPNSRTGILYSALWLATLCLSGGPSCTFSPGMLEVMPCCSKWSVLVKPLVDNANELYRLNLIGLAKTTPNAKVYLRANAIFGSTIQSFYGMSMNRTRSIKRSALSRRKKSNYRKTKRVRKNKTRKRK